MPPSFLPFCSQCHSARRRVALHTPRAEYWAHSSVLAACSRSLHCLCQQPHVLVQVPSATRRLWGASPRPLEERSQEAEANVHKLLLCCVAALLHTYLTEQKAPTQFLVELLIRGIPPSVTYCKKRYIKPEKNSATAFIYHCAYGPMAVAGYQVCR